MTALAKDGRPGAFGTCACILVPCVHLTGEGRPGRERCEHLCFRTPRAGRGPEKQSRDGQFRDRMFMQLVGEPCVKVETVRRLFCSAWFGMAVVRVMRLAVDHTCPRRHRSRFSKCPRVQQLA